MSKRRILTLTAIYLLIFSIFIHPAPANAVLTSSPLALFPPICYTQEMYQMPDDEKPNHEVMTDDETKIEIRFKVVDVIVSLFKKLFS